VVGNTGAFVAVKATVAVATIVAAERLWKDNKAAAIALMVASNSVAAVVAARNARTLAQAAVDAFFEVNHRRLFVKAWVDTLNRQMVDGEADRDEAPAPLLRPLEPGAEVVSRVPPEVAGRRVSRRLDGHLGGGAVEAPGERHPLALAEDTEAAGPLGHRRGRHPAVELRRRGPRPDGVREDVQVAERALRDEGEGPLGGRLGEMGADHGEALARESEAHGTQTTNPQAKEAMAQAIRARVPVPDGPEPRHRLMAEEIFGPLVTVYAYRESAIEEVVR
jgi:hypothetical protein